jgi:hypothetical protein
MKIPDTIRISGIDFEIEETDNVNDGERQLYGDVHYGNSKIRLTTDGQNHQWRCVSLWHEIYHVFCKISRIKLGELEEDIIDKFAFATYQVLQDNIQNLFDLQN